MSATSKMRLADFPADWQTLADAELCLLLQRARPAPAPRLTDSRSRADRIQPSPDRTGDAEKRADRGAVEPSINSAASPSASAATNSIEEIVRSHARSTRSRGVTSVQALVELKRMLSDAGHPTDQAAFKRARSWFVESYYLERHQAPPA